MGRTAFEKRLHWLGEWFEHLHGVDPELIEEITLSSMPTRLFRRGAGVDADIVMENVVRALSKGLVDEHPKLPKLLERLHKSFEIVARGADKSGLAYNELLAVRKEWEALSRVVKSSKVEGAKDFAQWFDREADELAAIAGQRSRASGAVKAAPAAKAAPLAKAPKGKGKGPDGRQIYEAFEAAAENASLGASWSLAKLSWFVGADDPVWPRIAEAAAKLDARDAEAMALKIQGILGEALAVRHPWVAHSLTEAAEQAKKLRNALGGEWKVVFVEAETYASKTAGEGLGQLYDASVWLVRPGPAGDLAGEAVPVWVLEVKSGQVSLAPKQIKLDFVREIGTKGTPTVRLPSRGTDGKRYKLHNLRELLAKEKVDPAKAGIGDPSTRRILVTPREPTDRSIIKGAIPKGVAIDYVHALMSGPEMRDCSRAIARRLKQLAKK